MAALAKQNLTPVTASSSMQPPAPSAHQSSLTPATMRNAINSSRGPGSSSRPSQSSLTAVPNLADKGKEDHVGIVIAMLTLGVFLIFIGPSPIIVDPCQ